MLKLRNLRVLIFIAVFLNFANIDFSRAESLLVNVSPSSISATVGSAITPVTITATGGTSPYTYEISPSLPSGLSLSGNTITGTPTAASPSASYTITVTDSTAATASTTITIVADIAPLSVSASSISATVGSAITPVTITATGGTSPYTYEISPSLPSGLSLSGNTITGTPTAASPSASYTITVTDSTAATASTTITIVADIAPLSVSASSISATVGSAITPVTITATGGTSPYTYEISPSLPSGLSLSGNTITGTPTAASPSASYTITVTDSTAATASTTITIVADIAPLSVSASSISATVGSAITPVTITATGGTSPYTYEISPSLPSGLSLSGNTITGTPTAASPSASYTITVTDSTAATASTTITIVADIAPLSVSASSISATVGSAITPVTITATGGTSPYTYEISPSLPSGLSLSGNTITGTPTAASPSASYTITVTDSTAATASTTITIVADIAPLSVSASSISATVGSAITPVTITATGGTSPYTYEISPSLPSGLSLSGNTITGTPTAASPSASYTITVTDSTAATASTTITIVADIAPLSVSASSISATVGSAITPVTITATGGTSPYTYEISPSLPSGLSLSGNTITGTPTAASPSASYTITVTDSTAATASTTITIVADIAPLSVSASSISATVGSAITPVTITATGGTSPYTYEISPSLPSGLSLSGNTITGTPTAASPSASYTITVTDSTAATASTTITIVADIAPLSVSASSISATVGSAITPVTITATGGTSPYTYEISPSLPSGLSLSGNTITGTPTAASPSASYTITVTDSTAATASTTITIVADIAPLRIIGPSEITVTFGLGKFVTYQAINSIGIAVFSLSGGIPYIYISPTDGLLSIPTNIEKGSYNFSINAVDSRGISISFYVSLNVTEQGSSSGTQLQNVSEITVTAPNLELLEGDLIPKINAFYSDPYGLISEAACNVYDINNKLITTATVGQFDITCNGAVAKSNYKIKYIQGLLSVTLDKNELENLSKTITKENPKIIYLFPSISKSTRLYLEDNKGKYFVNLKFEQGSVESKTLLQISPWPENKIDRGLLVLKIVSVSGSQTEIKSLKAPIRFVFPKTFGKSIPVMSPDGKIWKTIPQLLIDGLPQEFSEGYFINKNNEIIVYSKSLNLIGFRYQQPNLNLKPIAQKNLYSYKENVPTRISTLPGSGITTYQTLLPNSCEISEQGVVRSKNGGECIVFAVKESDNKYSSTSSNILTLKFNFPPTPKSPTPKPNSTASPKPIVPKKSPQAPAGFDAITGIEGVFTLSAKGNVQKFNSLTPGGKLVSEYNLVKGSSFKIRIDGLPRSSVISPILITPNGQSVILNSGKFDGINAYESQVLCLTSVGNYKFIFRIAGTNTARLVNVNIR